MTPQIRSAESGKGLYYLPLDQRFQITLGDIKMDLSEI